MPEAKAATPQIYAKMIELMREVEGVAKRDRNTAQNFAFRGIDAVVNAVGPALRKVGVVVVPTVVTADYATISTSNNRQMTSCRLQVDYTFWAEDGSSLTASVMGESFDAGDKATPKAMSVAFRTALLQALALPTDERDPDADSYEQVKTPMATKDQFAGIGAAFVVRGISEAAQKEAFVSESAGRKTNGHDLTFAEATKLLTDLQTNEVDPKTTALLEQSLGAKEIDNGGQNLPPEQTRAAALVDPPA